MDEPTRKSLLLQLRILLNMLPRYVRHDLWRTCEPHHAIAVDRTEEAIVAQIDEGFEMQEKTRGPIRSSTP
jgi:hypothetical protein